MLNEGPPLQLPESAGSRCHMARTRADAVLSALHREGGAYRQRNGLPAGEEQDRRGDALSLTSPTKEEIEFHYERTLAGTSEEKADSLAWLNVANMQLLLGHRVVLEQLAENKAAVRAKCLPEVSSVLHAGF